MPESVCGSGKSGKLRGERRRPTMRGRADAEKEVASDRSAAEWGDDEKKRGEAVRSGKVEETTSLSGSLKLLAGAVFELVDDGADSELLVRGNGLRDGTLEHDPRVNFARIELEDDATVHSLIHG